MLGREIPNDRSVSRRSSQLKSGLDPASVADLPLSSRTNAICSDTDALLKFKLHHEDEYDSNYESEEELLPATCDDGNKSIWRIFKAAIPFQVGLWI